MRVTFIRPNLYPGAASDALEPLCFAALAGVTPSGVELRLHDERLAPVPVEEPTDLVALTVETYTARRAYQIAAEYRRRGVPVVMGGYHATLLPSEVRHFADAVVMGDGEELWPRVLADARRGRLARFYRQEEFPSLAGQRPDRGIYAGKRYAGLAVVQLGRGCRFACEFCAIRAFYGQNLRQRPVAEVVAEIESLGRRNVLFADDNLFADPARARELFAALAPLGVRWCCQVSIDVARDPHLVQLMAASGCTVALIGFESLSPESLRQMGKAWNLKQGDYSSAIAVFRDAGILLYGTFVFGYDGDTADSFDAAVSFALAHRFVLANFNPLTPMPGTPLFSRLAREGRLLHRRWWLDPSYRYGEATFEPRGMTAAELTEGCWLARRRFSTWGSIGRRLLDRRTLASPYRAGLHLLANLISRREIATKQGRPLGDPDVPLRPRSREVA